MAHEIIQSQSYTFERYPAVVPSSAAVVARKAGGSELTSGAATVDSFAGTVSTVTDRQTLVLSTVSGLVAGRRYWLVPADDVSMRDMVTVESITVAGAGVTLGKPPHRLPQVGDRLLGARLTYQLTSSYTGTRGTNFELVWTITGADAAVTVERDVFHVVRTQFEPPVTAQDVRHYISTRWASEAATWDTDESRYREVARAASDLVRARIRESERYPHLVGEPDAFRLAGRYALQIQLLDERPDRRPAGERDDEETRLYSQLDRAVRAALRAVWHDSDDDGAVADPEELGRSVRSIQMEM
jgi:hypothetical protein